MNENGDRDIAKTLAENVRQLRLARGRTQDQMAALASVPRATWANLESGAANPTLSVLRAAGVALGVSLEELLSPPRDAGRVYQRSELREQKRGRASIRKLLPHPLPGVEIDRMELPPGCTMPGVPHTSGTREYLTCEVGTISVSVGGETYEIGEGDVVTFRGDQRHSYRNTGREKAVGYSVVLLVSPHA